MARRPLTSPTTIYWLYDTRPETIAKGWVEGYPFYCGKTIHAPEKRFGQHKSTAWRTRTKPVSLMILACGPFVEIRTIEVVPVSEDWQQREQHWIAVLRKLNPACTNVCDGGEGLPGYIRPKAYREPVVSERTLKARIMAACVDGKQTASQDRRALEKLRARNAAKRNARKQRDSGIYSTIKCKDEIILLNR